MPFLGNYECLYQENFFDYLGMQQVMQSVNAQQPQLVPLCPFKCLFACRGCHVWSASVAELLSKSTRVTKASLQNSFALLFCLSQDYLNFKPSGDRCCFTLCFFSPHCLSFKYPSCTKLITYIMHVITLISYENALTDPRRIFDLYISLLFSSEICHRRAPLKSVNVNQCQGQWTICLSSVYSSTPAC